MINSIESDRLQRLIDRKTDQYNNIKSKDPDNKALLYLNSEITLLRDAIMPIVLCNTTVDYAEIRDFVTKTMRRLEERKSLAKNATDIVFHFHIKNPEPGKPYIAAKASNMQDRLNTFDVQINYEQALIYPL